LPVQATLQASPARTVAGVVEQEMVGGCFGGSFTVNVALHSATFGFFLALSLTVAFTV
jgi:hypothetical protein